MVGTLKAPVMLANAASRRRRAWWRLVSDSWVPSSVCLSFSSCSSSPSYSQPRDGKEVRQLSRACCDSLELGKAVLAARFYRPRYRFQPSRTMTRPSSVSVMTNFSHRASVPAPTTRRLCSSIQPITPFMGLLVPRTMPSPSGLDGADSSPSSNLVDVNE